MFNYQSVKSSFVNYCKRTFSPYLQFDSVLTSLEEIVFGIFLVTTGIIISLLLSTVYLLTLFAKILVYGLDKSKKNEFMSLFKFDIYYPYLFAFCLIGFGLINVLSILVCVVKVVISIGYYFIQMLKDTAKFLTEGFLFKETDNKPEIDPEKTTPYYKFKFFNANIYITLIDQYLSHTSLKQYFTLLNHEGNLNPYKNNILLNLNKPSDQKIHNFLMEIKNNLKTKFKNDPYFTAYSSYYESLYDVKNLFTNLRLAILGILQISIPFFYYPIFICMFCFTATNWAHFRKERNKISEDLIMDLVRGSCVMGIGVGHVIFFILAIPMKLIDLSVEKFRCWMSGESAQIVSKLPDSLHQVQPKVEPIPVCNFVDSILNPPKKQVRSESRVAREALQV